MEKEIQKVIRYFAYFNYPPTVDEIYAFLPKKLKKKRFLAIFKKMTKKDLIKNHKLSNNQSNDKKKDPFPSKFQNKEEVRYTLGEYSIKKKNSSFIKTSKNNQRKKNNITIEQYNNFLRRQQVSKHKLNLLRFKLYLKLISFFPQIKLVGLSGTLAMMNAKENDDIDLFIITAKNRLFTGRFLAIILAWILGIRRWRSALHLPRFTKDKVCLNLFFDEAGLAVPMFKQTKYVAHEILQMKPIIAKGNIYKRFLKANSWVFRVFPNSKFTISNPRFLTSDQFPIFKIKYRKLNKNLRLKIKKIGDWVEEKLKGWQLWQINKHKTKEIITDTQLWFHPHDLERPDTNLNLKG